MSLTYAEDSKSKEQAIIAIDGSARAGKGASAKDIANYFGLVHVDTGMWYRAMTLPVLKFIGNDLSDLAIQNSITHVLNTERPLCIQFETTGGVLSILSNVGVEGNIIDITRSMRSPEVNNYIASIANDARVRIKVNASIREYIGTLDDGIVVDGRDIGTVVFPDADLKLWFTARLKVRATRELEFQKKLGIKSSLTAVAESLYLRDLKDKNRTVAPLKKPEGAIVIDTSDKTLEEVHQEVRGLVIDKLGLPPISPGPQS